MEGELQNEVNKLNGVVKTNDTKPTHVVNVNSGEEIVAVPPKKTKKNS